MRRTLFFIPHEIGPLPVFGFGWLLCLIVLAVLGVTIYQVRQGRSAADYWLRNGLLWGILAAAAVLILPRAELVNPSGEPVGLAIRGYGVMLLSGVVAAIALAVVRARRYGISEEVILAIAPWAVAGGIIGARLFYVIEYRDQFFSPDPLATIGKIFNFTQGGLVVYGSFIGGFVGAAGFVLRHGLPLLRLGDVIVPTLFIGLALGRVGCLMNGCCYGGPQEDNWAALRFPNSSPVFQDQLDTGQLVGIRLSSDRSRVDAVQPGSLAAARGIGPGAAVTQLGPVRSLELADERRPLEDAPYGQIAIIDGTEHYWSATDLPALADPVKPTQILGSLGGLFLCVTLCIASGFIYRDGVIMLGGFAGYAVLRFGMEMLRNDEPGQFGTELTIAQWVSIVVLLISLPALAWLLARDRRADVTQSISAPQQPV
jgi:phosphatidylglycerol---prolipoprotein diacylglyceryl transferase